MALFFLSFQLGGQPGWMRASSHLPGSVGLRRIVRVRCCLLPTSFPFPVGGGGKGGSGCKPPRPSSCHWQSRICGSGPGLLPVSNGALGANVREDLLPTKPFDGHRQPEQVIEEEVIGD